MRITLQKFSKRVFAKSNHVPSELLQKKWLPLWIELFQWHFTPRNQTESTLWSAIEYICENEKLLRRKPARPSEIAMAKAERFCKSTGTTKIVRLKLP